MADDKPDPLACHGCCPCPHCGTPNAFWSLITQEHRCDNPRCRYRFKAHDPKVFDGVRFHPPES